MLFDSIMHRKSPVSFFTMSRPLFAIGMVQANFFVWAFGTQIMKCFYMYNHNLCSKQSPPGTDLLWFFQKTEKLDFTPNFSIWPISKMRFVKNFENKKFQIFYTLNLEVSEHILNQKKNQKFFFCKKIQFGFWPIFWDFTWFY